MKQLKHSKESTVVQRESQRGKPLHKRLRFALVVFVCLFSRHLSNTLNQMTENVGTTNPSLPQGRLNFLTNLKRTGSTAPGIFMYNSFSNTAAQSQTFKFFDSEPVPEFVHQNPLTLSQTGLIGRMVYHPEANTLTGNSTSLFSTKRIALFIEISYDTDTSAFKITNAYPFDGQDTTSVPLRSSDTKDRCITTAPIGVLFESGLQITLEATKPFTFEATNREYIDQVTKIGKYALYLHRLGHILWDDETVPMDTISVQTLADFQPKYAVGDFSRPCTADNCDIVVFQERDNRVNHLSILSAKIANAPNVGSLKFASLVLPNEIILNMPVVMPFMNAVALTGSTKFYLYNIFEDRFEENTDFTSPTYSGLLPGSLNPGEFDLAKYPDQRPCMALFADGSNHQPRMFVLSTSRCKTRGADGLCTECHKEYLLSDQKYCNLCDPKICRSTEVPGSSSNSLGSSGISSPSIFSVLTNTFGLTFGPTQSRNILAIQVRDLTTQTLFSCAQLDCKYSWKGALLRISFTPSVTVTHGELVVRRKHSQSSSVASNRSLQSLDDSDIVIPNIKLTQTPSYIGWVTAGQVLLWLLRTVGSVVLFPKYPKLAMLPDLLITMSFILCTFLGPVILVADSAFELVGQIKILWFRIDSLVENWDTHTLSLSTAPNRWKYPVFCSFLDNYSQNTVGLLALALLLTVAKCVARRVAQHKQSSPRVSRVAAIVEKHFGTEYWLAKVYANSLEIMLYSLISFDKADASSKSIIGIMLAVVLFAAQVWLAVGATLTSASQSGTPHSTEPSRPYEQRPDTVLMTEASVTTRTSPAQIRWTDKTLRVLCFGWQQMPATNLKTVSRSKAFLETAFFLRNLGLCLVVLKVVSSPQAQLILAMCLQFCYLFYFVYCNVFLQKVEFVAALSLEVMMFVVLLFKTLSTIASISESNLQNALGALLLIVLILAIILNTGCSGLALTWSLRVEEKKSLEPAGAKLTVQDQPSPQEVRRSPGDEMSPSNLKIIIEDTPKPSPTEVALEQEVSMHSVPDEGLDPQKPTRSDAVSQQNL